MEQRVNELMDMLYQMIQEAWGLPLGADKCVIERDKALDLLDELRAQLPGELEEARRIVASRAEYAANAKREADNIRKNAETYAAQLVNQQEISRVAREKANALMAEAESKSAELRRVANEYADDALRRTEEAIGEALNEVRQSRAKFRSVSNAAANASRVDTEL